MPLTIVNQPVIAAGTSLSNALDISAQNVGVLRVICPAAWTGQAWLTFKMSNDNVQFYDVYEYSGALIVSRIVPNAMIIVRSELWRLGFIKFQSGTSANPVVQLEQRIFTCALE